MQKIFYLIKINLFIFVLFLFLILFLGCENSILNNLKKNNAGYKSVDNSVSIESGSLNDVKGSIIVKNLSSGEDSKKDDSKKFNTINNFNNNVNNDMQSGLGIEVINNNYDYENCNSEKNNYNEDIDSAKEYIDFTNPDNFLINVDLSEQKVYIYYKNSLLKTFLCSSGKAETPTPVGNFKTTEKIYYSYVARFEQAAYYWTRFYGSYLFHSVPYDKEGNILIEELQKMGNPASHGCVRLYLEDAKWLYDNLPLGVSVNIH